MKKYNVTITETLKKTVEVEAESLEEAEQKVTDAWHNSEYILDADNFTEVDFEAEEKAPDKIKVVLIEPNKAARITEIGTKLEDLQKVVGGYIEPAYYLDDPDCCIIVNDEGKIHGLPLNRAVYDDDEKMIDIIAGTAFICDCSGENFGSLSDEKLKKYTEKFKLPEKFYRIGDEIKAAPYQPKSKNQER
ncbi:MAG: DUF3846 domain-containing protein [Faecalibacterium sp.]|nr:DUF3846 domain-containing protein [Ruminococcus flavefaciens]MCM1391688.1 DUF3846 domain-containing protein [Ruminococcus sp.]MCM1484640.1 DUF3846 domain-containing protein [Faecalibacterium sp.]